MKSVVIVLLAVLCIASCGGGYEDLSYSNPEWRSLVNRDVTIPLAEQITLRVGIGSGDASASTTSLQWLEEATNIDLVFETLTSSPGDVVLGEMMRDGRLPDIIPEGRLSTSDVSTRQIFVDFLEFPEMTPNFYQIAQSDEAFFNSMLSRTSAENTLLTLGAYTPGKFVTDGVLAYRRDLFEKHRLSFDTWPELLESLRFLKEEYPDSYPLGGSFETLLYHLPVWWDSGLHPKHIVYFDPEVNRWKMGLYEPEFREAIQVLTELASERIISPDAFVLKDTEIRRLFANDTVFLAPYTGGTGPFFGYPGDGYGGLDDEGNWNGEGKWIDAMPLPKSPSGESTRYSSRFLDTAGKGWQVYNQSSHVGEAIALLDYLFSEEAGLVMSLGPQGTVWEYEDQSPVLLEPYSEAYRTGWLDGLRAAISDGGIQVGSPLSSREPDYLEMFGVPEIPGLRYYLRNDMQRNRPGIDITLQPGVRFPEEEQFLIDRATIIVSLQTEIESKIAGIVAGQRPFEDFDKMVEDMKKYGDRLLELYNTWCIIPDPSLLAGAN